MSEKHIDYILSAVEHFSALNEWDLFQEYLTEEEIIEICIH